MSPIDVAPGDIVFADFSHRLGGIHPGIVVDVIGTKIEVAKGTTYRPGRGSRWFDDSFVLFDDELSGTGLKKATRFEIWTHRELFTIGTTMYRKVGELPDTPSCRKRLRAALRKRSRRPY